MRECPTCNFLVTDGLADCSFCGPADAEIVEVTTIAAFPRPDRGERADEGAVPVASQLVVATERVGHEPAPTGSLVVQEDGPSSDVGDAFPVPYPAPWPATPAADRTSTMSPVAERAMNLTIVMCLLIGAVLLGLGITLLLVVV